MARLPVVLLLFLLVIGEKTLNTSAEIKILSIAEGAKNDVELSKIVKDGKLFGEQRAIIGPPTNITVHEVTNTSIFLGWAEPASPDEPIARYHIGKRGGGGAEETIPVSGTSHALAGLFPFRDYDLRIRAIGENTEGRWSEPVRVKTKVGVPFSPLSLRVVSSTSTSLALEWKEPDPPTGPVASYRVRWERSAPGTGGGGSTGDTNLARYEVTDLEPYSSYEVQVQAETEAGEGPWSPVALATTRVGIPSTPQNLSTNEVNSTAIAVSWSAPARRNGPLRDYLVYWGRRGESSELVFVEDAFFVATDLETYTEYVFQVAASTEAGRGAYTDRLVVRTSIDLPGPPRNVTASNATSSTVSLEWSEPGSTNGPLLYYIVRYGRLAPDDADEQNGPAEAAKAALEDDERTTVNVLPRKNILFTVNTTSAVVEGLFPFAIYVVQVCAATDAGPGPWSRPLEVYTAVGVPSAPRLLSTESGPTRIGLYWRPPEFSNGPLLFFSVTWGMEGVAEPPARVVVFGGWYEAVGLRPYTDYRFVIRAATEAGDGLGAELVIKSGTAVPSATRTLAASDVTDTSAVLTWQPPEHPGGPGMSYTVQWAPSGYSVSSGKERATTSSRLVVEGLEPSTRYVARAWAKNTAGRGRWSEVGFTSAEKRGKNNLPVILGLVFGLVLPLLLIAVFVGLFIARKKGLLYKPRSDRSTISPPRRNEPSTERPTMKMKILHPVTAPTELSISTYEEYMNSATRYGKSGFSQEFEKLQKESPRHECNAAKMEENLTKNRWVKILPFDYSRVKIQPDKTSTQSNYINANYIPGESHLLEYIAAQGPLPNTVAHLWSLVWQQSVPLVVMLTQCVERAVRNCEAYWPGPGETRLYGDVQVRNGAEAVHPSHVERTLEVKHQNQQRQITHMHYSNWPVMGCPGSPDDFLHFIRVVRNRVSDRRPGPILVHCSAGVGRTGTFIAVDRILQHLKNHVTFDVYGTVLEMRQYRPHMVHTEDQYTFIYSCLQKALQDRNEAPEAIYETLP